MKICIAGHKPKNIHEYDNFDPKWITLKEQFKKLLIENNCDEAIFGAYLGVDTVFALAVLELKEEGYNIKLHCVVPYKNYSCGWDEENIELYDSILSKADIVKIIHNKDYTPWLIQVVTMYMVDLADKVIAAWDGSERGTASSVYVNQYSREIIRIIP